VIGAAVAAVGALAACGPIQVGAAAIVGGQRISASALGTQVTNLKQAYQAGRAGIQLQFPLSQAPQQVLGWMLRFRIRDELAARNHVAVSTGASQRALASIAAQSGRTGRAFTDLAVANGIPPDLLPALGRFEAIQAEVVNRLDGGRLPASTAAQQRISAALAHRECVAAKSLHIKINPQFGQLDYASLAVVPAPTPLSALPKAAPSSAPRRALTPPC
jgi:peptidyl-prolyl cis-trans isomerase SurA